MRIVLRAVQVCAAIVIATTAVCSAAQAEPQLWAAYRSAGTDTAVAHFNSATGQHEGGVYLDAGVRIPFSGFGGMAFAPDGSLWAAYQSGGTDTAVAMFNKATGQHEGGVYLDAGVRIPFSDFGGLAFAPDGNLWAAYRSAGTDTAVAMFDKTTGQHMGGVYLDAGVRIPFDDFGGFAFAPDGTLWAAYRSAGTDTAVAMFDTATGQHIGGVYLDAGVRIPFDDFGGLAFDEDGNLWAAYLSAGTDTAVAMFDKTTGQHMGGVYLDAGVRIPFGDFGGLAFAPGADDTPVPEPATLALFGLGALTLAGLGRRRRTDR